MHYDLFPPFKKLPRILSETIKKNNNNPRGYQSYREIHGGKKECVWSQIWKYCRRVRCNGVGIGEQQPNGPARGSRIGRQGRHVVKRLGEAEQRQASAISFPWFKLYGEVFFAYIAYMLFLSSW